ncbi:hypothetical protein KTE26_21975 [Ralstonia mannitolilytica]|uniref:hypothetical protein n=1 Tax=Ralstonia mannitolilytica TaxID=105219 RepID=UPI000CEE118C|nr:hypothetical protein [Ralstonia mannitolilytica]MBU9581106.1 hypothetical protein [Ralstonia mannitolilytica]
MPIWRARLKGDAQDLEFLAQALGTGPRTVERGPEGSAYFYESESFRWCCTAQEVTQIAEEELAILSGILKLERSARDSLTYDAICRANANGGEDVFVFIRDSVQARDEVGSVAVVATDAAGNVIAKSAPPPPRAVGLFQLAADDEAVAKVLRLLDAVDAASWVGLYRICEVIEADVGGQHPLEKRGWGSADDLRRFKHSANSVQVGGDESRHGKEPRMPPKNPMTLPEAQGYVNYILQAWLAHKGA